MYADGQAEWYYKGVRYTPEGDLELTTDAFTAFYSNGALHRSDNLPALVHKKDSTSEYYINGQETTPELLNIVFAKNKNKLLKTRG